MKTIYKYTLAIDDQQFVSMPDEAELLAVQFQAGIGPCLWVLVDTDKASSTRVINIRGTGHEASNVGKYIDTFQMHGGRLVYHAFDAGYTK